jgi:NitT/TauT family transport system substrate-binding protein
VTLVVGWIPTNVTGPFYAAQREGFYEEVGLEVEIIADFDTSPVTPVALGEFEFGLPSADELIEARAQGAPLVAVFASFQSSPRTLIYHEENPVNTPEDLSGRTAYIFFGGGWWELIKYEFNLQDVKEVQYNPQAFARDPNAVIQGFIGTEITTEQEFNLELGTITNTDITETMNEYWYLIGVNQTYLEQNPDTVRKFVEASTKGFEYYRENNEEIDEYMQQFDAQDPPDIMDQIFDLQEPLMFGGDAESHGVGWMSLERWEGTVKALEEIGFIEEGSVDPADMFTTEFLVDQS